MAAIDFPASPTTGQTFSAPNGVIYQWDSVKWVIAFAPAGMVALKTNAPNAMAVSQWATLTVSWASVDFNVGGGTWNGSQYTVPVAGLYKVDFSLGLNWPAGAIYVTQGEAYILINGAIVHETSISHAAAQGPLYVTYPVSSIFNLAVGNTISFQMFSGNGNASFTSSKQWTYASIVRLGS
jgi:hypothetical protein